VSSPKEGKIAAINSKTKRQAEIIPKHLLTSPLPEHKVKEMDEREEKQYK